MGSRQRTWIATLVDQTRAYRGRFAPSPTGPLHFGSLVAAVASYLDARHAGGEWLLRIEDLDPPREVPGSADQIVATLDALRLRVDWVHRAGRATRHDAYQAALERLLAAGLRLSLLVQPHRARRLRSRRAATSPTSCYYPGWCRNGARAPDRPLRDPLSSADRHDRVRRRDSGTQTAIDVAPRCGDFVIRRRDGLFAYQLAVVVDDAAQGITHVVRGADLLDSTPRQILLASALGSADSRVRTFAASHRCEWDQTLQVGGRRSGRCDANRRASCGGALQFLQTGAAAGPASRPGWRRCGSGRSSTGSCSRSRGLRQMAVELLSADRQHDRCMD